MQYTFIRKGFANNSSSSHSIIFAPDAKLFDEYNGAEFGWDFFTCSSTKAKDLYLLATLKSNFRYDEEQEFNTWILNNFNDTFFNINELLEEVNDGYGVDHQSVIIIPNDYDNPNRPSVEFVKELINELRNSDYVILGGNDNSDVDHNFTRFHQNTAKSENLINFIKYITDNARNSVAVKDEKTHEWIISNFDDGDIIKFLFDEDLKKYNVESIEQLLDEEDRVHELQKSSFPYLVDLNITNYCPFKCAFCYQSSTNAGNHANADFIIDKILPELKQSKVFEIVLGGGEPSLHPEFEKIVKAIKKENFKLAITTKNYNLLKSLNDPASCMENIDSIAISCNNLVDLEKAALLDKEIYDMNKFDRPTMYIQTVIGTQTVDEFQQFINACIEYKFNNITLLGWKDFGFGKNITPHSIGNKWINIIKKVADDYWMKFGIDSVLVKAHRSELLHNNVKWEYLVGAEGKQTCYINAVDKYVAASSFTNKNIVNYNFDTTDFNKIFSKF